DLAGFKKDRFYIYQARWRPQLKMAHILPHWTWPERVGQVTPVHVYTSGDEAELFLNGKSLGRKTRGAYEYRLRWDEVVYQPGELGRLDNGDATNFEPFQGTEHSAFNGLCLVIIRATGQPGEITLQAAAEGLKPGRISLKTK